MLDSNELFSLLRLFANKQNNPVVYFAAFCDYIQKYARHYLEAKPELVVFLDNPQGPLTEILEPLEQSRQVISSLDSHNRKILTIPQFYIDKIAHRYKEIINSIEVPFPTENELDPQLLNIIVETIHFNTEYFDYFEGTAKDSGLLKKAVFTGEIPPLLIPPTISPEKLTELCVSKLRIYFIKNDFKDFILKKLLLSNPGKEISMRNFMNQLLNKPSDAVETLKNSGEAFLFWNSLCSFSRQDVTKKNELSTEDISFLQGITFLEYANNYYKTKTQQKLQKETALKNLSLCFQKPPYYYSGDDISRFTDSRGVPLLGQFSKEDLEEYMQKQTTSGSIDILPEIIVFSLQNGERYFILKEKVFPLILLLAADARKPVKNAIVNDWLAQIKNYEVVKEIKDKREFEKKVDSKVASFCPILDTIAKSSFIPQLISENTLAKNATSGITAMIDKGHLVSYSVLLSLSKEELATDTKILLPFWYTIPILSAIIAFFKRPRNPKKKKFVSPTIQKPEEADTDKLNTSPDKKEAFRKAAKAVQKKLVREGSTLELDMSFYLERWNRNLNQDLKENLTEDINVLIRDYLRKVLKTLPAASFTLERIENLATALADTPTLQKIRNRDALISYIECYMVQLVSK